jgi:hypothetical protein
MNRFIHAIRVNLVGLLTDRFPDTSLVLCLLVMIEAGIPGADIQKGFYGVYGFKITLFLPQLYKNICYNVLGYGRITYKPAGKKTKSGIE